MAAERKVRVMVAELGEEITQLQKRQGELEQIQHTQENLHLLQVRVLLLLHLFLVLHRTRTFVLLLLLLFLTTVVMILYHQNLAEGRARSSNSPSRVSRPDVKLY